MFDKVLYINLAMRVDRKREIEEELQNASISLENPFRIEAIFDEFNGTRACAASHIKALTFALERGWDHVLVLEDDCRFTKSRSEMDLYVQKFMHHFKNEWDVFFLGASPRCAQETGHPDYHRVLFALHSHAYLVNGHYIRKLRDYFVSIFESMKDDLFFVSSFEKALDRKWVDLQLADRWFIGKEPVAEQRDSYSDIEKKMKVRSIL